MATEETIRIHQANERTMLAWVRTGIALMAFGFAIARFSLFLRQLTAAGAVALGSTHSLGSAWLGAMLVALGMTTSLLATIRYAHVRSAIERGQLGPPSPVLVYALGTIASLVGLVMTALLVRALAE